MNIKDYIVLFFYLIAIYGWIDIIRTILKIKK